MLELRLNGRWLFVIRLFGYHLFKVPNTGNIIIGSAFAKVRDSRYHTYANRA